MANDTARTDPVPYDFTIHRDQVVGFITEQLLLPRENPLTGRELVQLVARELGIRVSDTNINNLKSAARQVLAEKGGDVAPAAEPPPVAPPEHHPTPKAMELFYSRPGESGRIVLDARPAVRRRNRWECPEGSTTLEQLEDDSVFLEVQLRVPPKVAFAVNDLLWNEVFSADQEAAVRG
jgi:hypothetical protein